MARTRKPDPKPQGSLSSRSRGPESTDEMSKPLDERETLKHFQTFLKDNEIKCREAWNNAEENQRFAAGGKGQWDADAWQERNTAGKLTFSLDDCGLATRAISGREMTARFEPTFLSRSPDDGPRINVFREAVRYKRQVAFAEDIESAAFRDLTIDAHSVVELSQEFDGRHPHGWTRWQHAPLWEHVWDTTARETCLTDRQRDARGYFVTVDEFLMQFPKERDRLQELINTKKTWVTDSVRTAYRHPWSAMAQKGAYIKRQELQVFLVSYHYRKREAAYLAAVPAGLPGLDLHPIGEKGWANLSQALGQELPLVANTEMWDQVRPVLEAAAAQGLIDPAMVHKARPRLTYLSADEWAQFQEVYGQQFQQMPTALTPEDGVFRWGLYEAMIVGDHVVKERKLPYRHFPRIYLTAVPFNQLTGTVYHSVIDAMKDPQRFKNVVVSMAAVHLQKMQKMGMLYHAGALENPEQLAEEIAKPFWLLAVKNGIDFAQAVDVVEGANFPPGLDQFLQLADAATLPAVGLNKNTLGALQDPRRVSGNVFQALADAVMTVLSIEFNGLRKMRMLGAELNLDMIREYHDRDDLIDIVGPTKAQFVPEKEEWKYAFQYDAIVDEVPVSKSEKEAGWEYMSRQGTMDKGIAGGYMPPWLMVKMMPDAWIAEEDRRLWLAGLEARGMGPNSWAQPPQPPQGGGQPAPEGG